MITIRKIGTTLFLLAFLANAADAQISSVSQDTEAYRVYEAIIAREWPVTVAKAKRVVIQQETSDAIDFLKRDPNCMTPVKEQEMIYAPLIRTYKEINKNPTRLESKFSDPLFFELVPGERIRSFFAERPVGDPDGSWNLFYKAYPDSGGYIQVSAVAFNNTKTFAMIYISHHCGMLCAGGRYHFLKKESGKWIDAGWKGTTCGWAS